MNENPDAPDCSPNHFFVEIEKDGEKQYVLCGAIYSVSKDKLSEATFAGIEKLFERETLRAIPVDDPDSCEMPVKFCLYSFQSGRN